MLHVWLFLLLFLGFCQEYLNMKLEYEMLMQIQTDTIARNIKSLRENHGKNQEQFAADLGVARPTISNWENGKVLPTSEQLFRIVEVYSISLDELIGLNLSSETWVVPDTSILISRPRLINELVIKFDHVVLSQTVISELNGLKDGKKYVSNQARLSMKSIESERDQEHTKIEILDDVSSKSVADDRIIDLGKDLAKKHTNGQIFVISRDVYFSLQKDEPGVKFLSPEQYDKMFGDKMTHYDYDRSQNFYNAVKSKSIEKAKKEYEKGAVNPNQIDANRGLTPLIQAVRNNDCSMVKFLLTLRDLDIDAVDESKYCIPAISHAIQTENLDMAKILVDAGCDVNRLSTGKNSGNTPLMIAAWHGRDEFVKMLISAGACLNQQDSNGFTPLIKACLRGHPTTAKILLDNKKTDIDIRDRNGKTALDQAYDSGNIEIKKLFIPEDA